MNYREALRNGMGMLTGAGVPSPSTAAEVLLLHLLGRDRAYLYAHPEEELDAARQHAYQELLERRAAGVPTQYLTATQEFWGLEFEVNPSVLIPRPETEHVVEAALEIVREKLKKPDARAVSIVDVGTGSGCIALALAHELPGAKIHAIDVSEDALAVARRNAERLGLAGRVQFAQSDLLDIFLAPGTGSPGAGLRSCFDLIVSNPPYVSESEAESLPREVREHEPPGALFAGEDGLDVTRRLVEQAKAILHPGGPARRAAAVEPESGHALRSLQSGGGWLVLELGYNQADRVRSLFENNWSEVEIRNDLRDIPRVLIARRL